LIRPVRIGRARRLAKRAGVVGASIFKSLLIV